MALSNSRPAENSTAFETLAFAASPPTTCSTVLFRISTVAATFPSPVTFTVAPTDSFSAVVVNVSSPSGTPSPSVSGSVGSVGSVSSSASSRPSPSVSGSAGSVPFRSSAASRRPSASVSA